MYFEDRGKVLKTLAPLHSYTLAYNVETLFQIFTFLLPILSIGDFEVQKVRTWREGREDLFKWNSYVSILKLDSLNIPIM